MAEEEPEENEDAGGDDGGGGDAGGSSKKRLLIIGILLFVVLAGAGGGAFFMMSGGEKPKDPDADPKAEGEAAPKDGEEKPKDGEGEGKEGEKTAEGEGESKDGEKVELGPDGKPIAKPKEKEEEEEETFGFGKTVKFNMFSLNLGNPLENHYVRLDISVEVKTPKAEKELIRRKPQLRDAIVSIVSNKTREFLLNPDGKEQLRSEILLQINHYMKNKVERVFITDILIE